MEQADSLPGWTPLGIISETLVPPLLRGGCDTLRVPRTGLAQGERSVISRCGVSLRSPASDGLSPEPSGVRTKAKSFRLVSLKGVRPASRAQLVLFYGRSHFMGQGVKAGGWRARGWRGSPNPPLGSPA